MPRTPEYDEVDEVLYVWYRWANGYSEVSDYGNSDSTCRDFQTSRQWMDHAELSDLVDYRIRKHTGEKVEKIVFSLLQLKHRVAINVAMKNMECGFKVWHNPRFPDAQEGHYVEAKRLMLPRLITEGLVNPETTV